MSSDMSVEEDWNGQYHWLFPGDWAESHLAETGPEECLNCRAYGLIDGFFAGYCSNCAQLEYRGSRGRGLCGGNGVEFQGIGNRRLLGDSVYDTYLKPTLLPWEEQAALDGLDHYDIDCPCPNGVSIASAPQRVRDENIVEEDEEEEDDQPDHYDIGCHCPSCRAKRDNYNYDIDCPCPLCREKRDKYTELVAEGKEEDEDMDEEKMDEENHGETSVMMCDYEGGYSDL